MRAITYARVSTEDQTDAGNGLDAQADAMTAATTFRGWTVVAALVDEGCSAGNMRRPALIEALDRLDRGEADALVVAKLDRLSRSVLDFSGIAERAKRHGWAVVALDVDVDTTTPTGELVASIMASVAQWERRIIGARTSDALQAKKARGCRLGGPVRLSHDLRHSIAEDHAAGVSLSAIARNLNADDVPTARGGARWYASTVRAVIQSVALDAEAVTASAPTLEA